MTSSLHLTSDITEPIFAHAWRADRGTERSTVHAIIRLGASDLSIDNSQTARELAAAAALAAGALARLEADPDLGDIDGRRYTEPRIGQTAELLECGGGDQCHALEEFEAAAAALGRIRTLQQLTTVLAKVAHHAPEVIVRAVAELAP